MASDACLNLRRVIYEVVTFSPAIPLKHYDARGIRFHKRQGHLLDAAYFFSLLMPQSVAQKLTC